MANFDSKSFNPEAFGHYVKRIPNPAKNELAKSRAVGVNLSARAALGGQGGSLYARVPYFGLISAATSQNNDGATDISANTTASYEQGFVTASRMDGWTERSFSKSITAGVDFMDNVAAQIADYKAEVEQNILLKMLEGVFSMDTSGTDTAGKAAKDFINYHTYDITGKTGDDAYIGVDTLNRAMQKACGDNKNIFKLCVMHSEVAARLENLQLMKYLTYTDKDGISRELSIGTWNGRTVLIDDNMPTKYVAASGSGDTAVAAYTSYTTYILGAGSIILDDIGDAHPYELTRDPAKNGGEDTLYVRQRFICGVDGLSFEKPASLVASASNDDLANGENWSVINNGVEAVPHKSIAIARIISKG